MKTLLAVLVLWLMTAAAALAQLPNGPFIHVSTQETGYQYGPAAIPGASGNFVVVWTSTAQDGDETGVFGQDIDAAGQLDGPEFQVNTYTTGRQWFPAAASDASGSFVVAWDNGPDAIYFTRSIQAQRYDAQGLPIGGEFRVNTTTASQQSVPAIASDPFGNFVVVWQGDGQDGSFLGVFGQRFDALGARQGGEFQVNTFTTGFQYAPAVAMAPSGNFIVTWMSGLPTQDGSGVGVYGRCYAASGTPLGGEFRVNTYTTGDQANPRVTGDGQGRFVAVWNSAGQDGSQTGVFGQRLDSTCAPQGTEFRVNTYTTARQDRPDVAADEDGNFMVVWQSTADGSYSVFGQRYDASGTAVGTEFRVETYSTGNQSFPRVASNPDGDFIVTWSGQGPTDTSGIYAQRYGDLIFEDGFDSGTLLHWSSSSTDGSDLAVNAASAMGGTTRGLRARVNDTNSLFVQDDTPNGENRYRARFYFDPNGFDPGEASAHFRSRLMLAQGGGFRLVTIVLKRQGGAYSVEARVRTASGGRIDTGFKPITDAPHIIEFDWARASLAGASDGSFELWIDDVSVATLAGLDNGAFGVDQARLGALSLKTGASGTLFFDQFESRRVRHMGPE